MVIDMVFRQRRLTEKVGKNGKRQKMKITPIQEEILTKLYEKAYKTEPTEENLKKYILFINEERLDGLYEECVSESFDLFSNYSIFALAIFAIFVMIYNYDEQIVPYTLPTNFLFQVSVFFFLLGTAFIATYSKNSKRRKITRLLKPFFKRAEEISNKERELKKIERERYRTEKEKKLIEKENQLRAKYL